MKLLMVDSDRDLVEMITGWLRARGYEVTFAFTPERAQRLWRETQPDLVLLDPASSSADLLRLCREERQTHDALVLVATSVRDAAQDSAYLDAGADGVLSKPFLPGLLLAHLRALSRRVRSTLARNPATILTVGPLRLDTVRHEVMIQGQPGQRAKTVRLTPTESRLLHLLVANVNDICPLEQIVTHVWGWEGSGDTYLVKAHIRHLREKIEPNPSQPRYILTEPGVGYRLKRPVEASETMEAAALEEAAEPDEAALADGAEGIVSERVARPAWQAEPVTAYSTRQLTPAFS
ncbi:MAG TPA: response regulator transcription factor [Ktedonobacterales bacterium]|nr:response regulator transcription factor [Ktedonobacterales bacterium]